MQYYVRHSLLLIIIAGFLLPVSAHFQKRPARVTIDPGHGGKDPGASLKHTYFEKNIALAVARKLKNELNKNPMIHAHLTRSQDYFISLRHRLNIARQQQADLFVSIHADGFFDRHAHGLSIYTLSEKGATSEASRWLAHQENRADFIGGESLENKSNMLRKVLIDMQQTATIHKSMAIAQTILKTIKPTIHLHQKHIEQAAFIVLKSPDIPSILIETGFISNPTEAKKLYQPQYQQQLAHAISKGVTTYFKHHPLENHLSKPKRHITVKAGDTLYQLARRYHTPVQQLATINHLAPNSQLNIGATIILSNQNQPTHRYHSLGKFIKSMFQS
jgi:N-acetylmuramoyl-L-alanine amidase